jgi:CubicO group peptidase (beta-lactamase class C family)
MSDPIAAYAEKVRGRWHVPGLAYAVVNRDSVIDAAGLGRRQLGSEGAVTESTIFTIGSLTKAFTAAALGILLDDGLVDWDDPVTKHLYGFQLPDPCLTRMVTIRDLLAHRVGWEESYWENFASRLGYSRAELIRRIRFNSPWTGFRSNYVYNNMLYTVAGEVVIAATGEPWEKFVERRIFQPLGMTSTTASVAGLLAAPDRATSHIRGVDDELRADLMLPEKWWTMDNHGPSGSINSSIDDMTRWVRLLLGEGRWDGRSVFSTAVAREMHRPQMLVEDEADEDDGVVVHAYGLGWRLGWYKGLRYVYHSGAFRGMSAFLGLLPQSALGVVVLANSRDAVQGGLPGALALSILDRQLGGPGPDWPERRWQNLQARRKQMRRERMSWLDGPRSDVRPSLSLEKFVGYYDHPAFGTWTVGMRDAKLIVTRDIGDFRYEGTLEHWEHDTFQSTWCDPLPDYWPARFVSFSSDGLGHLCAMDFRQSPKGPARRFERTH